MPSDPIWAGAACLAFLARCGPGVGQVQAGLGSQERRWGESGLRLGQRADRRGLHQCRFLFGKKGQRRFLEEACASLNNSKSHDFLSSFPAVLVAITCRVCESPVAGTRVGDSPGLQGVFSQRRLPRRRGAQGLCQGGRGGAGGAAWLSGLKAARRREGRAKRRRRGPLPRTLRGEWKRTGGQGGPDCPSRDRQRGQRPGSAGCAEPAGLRRRRPPSRLASASAPVSDPSACKSKDSGSWPGSLS